MGSGVSPEQGRVAVEADQGTCDKVALPKAWAGPGVVVGEITQSTEMFELGFVSAVCAGLSFHQDSSTHPDLQ